MQQWSSLDVAVLAGVNVFSAVLNLATNSLRTQPHPDALSGLAGTRLIARRCIRYTIPSTPGTTTITSSGVLALWDWLLGTLYIPARDEVIRFGLGDAKGDPRRKGTTLRAALVEPVARARN